MLETILQGVGLGLTLALLIGPAFFAMLQTSIDRGFRSAAFMALGVSFSDLVLVTGLCFGAANVLNDDLLKNIVGMVGGGILLGFGAYTYMSRGAYLNKRSGLDPNLPKDLPKGILYFVKGFFLNLANPATWFFWIVCVGVMGSQFSETNPLKDLHLVVFFGSALVMVLSTDLIKCYIAHQLKCFITDRLLALINRIVGIILVLFGLYLIISSILPFLNPQIMSLFTELSQSIK